MVDVIKKTGKKQRFSKAKLEKGLQKSLKDAKVSAAKAKVIIKDISEGIRESIGKMRRIKATDLRTRVLGRLERRSKAAAKAWRRYDKKH